MSPTDRICPKCGTVVPAFRFAEGARVIVTIPHNSGRKARVVGRRSNKHYPEIYTVEFADGSFDENIIPQWMATQ